MPNEKPRAKPGPKEAVLQIDGDYRDALRELVRPRPPLPKRCQRDHAHAPVYCGCGGGDTSCLACKGLGYICPYDSAKRPA